MLVVVMVVVVVVAVVGGGGLFGGAHLCAPNTQSMFRRIGVLCLAVLVVIV